jgi:hypothetical protein
VGASYREKLRDAVPPALRPAPVPKGAVLPAGAQHYVVELHTLERKAPPPPRDGKPLPPGRKPLPPLKPLLVHVLLVPDGPRTWLAVGGDEGVTAARLATALGSGGDKLASRAALAPLKEGTIGAGGFLTARGVPEAGEQLPLIFNGATWMAKEAFDEAAQMPHRGTTPILFTWTAQPGGATAHVTVPRDAIEDGVATILKRGGF